MQPETQTNPTTAAESALPRVLIADDNPQGVELLEAYLSGCAYETETAADGEETLRKVAAWKPDLILLDIMMPKISGFEVCNDCGPIPNARHCRSDDHRPRPAQ